MEIVTWLKKEIILITIIIWLVFLADKTHALIGWVIATEL